MGIRFTGTTRHTLDNKNRLMVPKDIRDAVPVNDKQELVFHLTLGFDECLYLLDEKGWLDFCEAIDRAEDPSSADDRNFSRLFYSSAAKTICDSHGRILVPEELKKLVKIGRDVKLAGIKNRLEIWDLEAWDRHFAGHVGRYTELGCQVLARLEARGGQRG